MKTLIPTGKNITADNFHTDFTEVGEYAKRTVYFEWLMPMWWRWWW